MAAPRRFPGPSASDFDVVTGHHAPWKRVLRGKHGRCRAAAGLAAPGSRHWSQGLVPLLAEVAPAAAAVVTPLSYDPGPRWWRLGRTRATFGSQQLQARQPRTGRPLAATVLARREQPGLGAPLSDLACTLSPSLPPPAPSRRSSIAPTGKGAGSDVGRPPHPGWGSCQLGCACSAPWSIWAWAKALGDPTRSSRGGTNAGSRAASLLK